MQVKSHSGGSDLCQPFSSGNMGNRMPPIAWDMCASARGSPGDMGMHSSCMYSHVHAVARNTKCARR